MAQVRPARAVEAVVAADTVVGGVHGLVGMEVELLVPDRASFPFDEHVVAPATLAVHQDRQAPRSTRRPCRSITTTRYKVISIAQTLSEGVIASVRIRYDKIGCPGACRLVLGLPYSAVMPMRRISSRSASLKGSLSKYTGLRLMLTIWAWRVIG